MDTVAERTLEHARRLMVVLVDEIGYTTLFIGFVRDTGALSEIDGGGR